MSRWILASAGILSLLALLAMVVALRLIAPSLEDIYVQNFRGTPSPPLFLVSLRTLPSCLFVPAIVSALALLRVNWRQVPDVPMWTTLIVSFNLSLCIMIIAWYFLYLALPFTNSSSNVPLSP